METKWKRVGVGNWVNWERKEKSVTTIFHMSVKAWYGMVWYVWYVWYVCIRHSCLSAYISKYWYVFACIRMYLYYLYVFVLFVCTCVYLKQQRRIPICMVWYGMYGMHA